MTLADSCQLRQEPTTVGGHCSGPAGRTMYYYTLYELILWACVVSVTTCLDNYGPYTFEIQKAEKCIGPKKAECVQMTYSLKPNTTLFNYELNITKNSNIKQLKIELYNVDNGGKKKMFNYVFDKPCQHFLLGPVVNEIFNVGTNCKIAKGMYRFFLDAHKMSQKFFGNNFFYGLYQMKTSVSDANCNLFCMILVSDFKKKVT